MSVLKPLMGTMLLLLMPLVVSAGESGSGTSGLGITGDGAAYLGQMVVGLILVIVAILVLGFMMRRMGGMHSGVSGELRVLGAVSLGARERMVLVQVGKTQLLLGVAPGRVQTLHVLDEPIRPGERVVSEKNAGAFAERLRHAMGRQGGAS
ncbi:flagellar biosynthetic protein FliO [Ectothiorhodospira lacustris]|uniref:flagellar biosynthetic protein FliO n=1 Tax=Ectothiorhodospira lacustris TaxID=2899127 RepID=UPI001EE7FEE9|nr:flagellar biosynthetic protein FliO [Ectothiorhodospira lacustris]MCG5499521.1 flagellar biosynthetic protein FliO [Ectothiorhodospira lacustris]MCG5511099.1 flagellar biosynthetic protein FliO [Ectothiorhodospira lacustris]MCG5522893.1 flagellar biosynthetic protein FliO [Ectothiorhodospira lacustris]